MHIHRRATRFVSRGQTAVLGVSLWSFNLLLTHFRCLHGTAHQRCLTDLIATAVQIGCLLPQIGPLGRFRWMHHLALH